MVEGIYKCMFHPSLPVKFTAIAHIHKLLTIDAVQALLKSKLKEIIQCHLTMMDEVGSDEIGEGIRILVETFK